MKQHTRSTSLNKWKKKKNKTESCCQSFSVICSCSRYKQTKKYQGVQVISQIISFRERVTNNYAMMSCCCFCFQWLKKERCSVSFAAWCHCWSFSPLNTSDTFLLLCWMELCIVVNTTPSRHFIILAFYRMWNKRCFSMACIGHRMVSSSL